jgi:two-component system LytT family sensor kinase
LRVEYSVAPDLEDSLVPQLILQPLLENSLRHGMKPGDGTMDLSVAAHRENGSLILRVSDNGAGFPGDDASTALGRGLGLTNIRNRLAQLYGDEQNFLIGNRAGGGAEITLRVPFHKALPS